jgi:hypothetical protein
VCDAYPVKLGKRKLSVQLQNEDKHELGNVRYAPMLILRNRFLLKNTSEFAPRLFIFLNKHPTTYLPLGG